MKVQRTATATNTIGNLARWNEIHTTAMSGNISYGYTMAPTQTIRGATFPTQDASQNMACWKHQDTSPAVGTEIAIPHSLPYVPLTIVGADTDNGSVLYRSTNPDGSTKPWTKAQIGIDPVSGKRRSLPGYIYLKCTAAGSKYNVIFG